MERCPSCGRTRKLYHLSFMPRSLCDQCFCRNIERRVRREIRTQLPLKKGQTVVLVDDGSCEARVLCYILKRLQHDFPFSFKKAKRIGKAMYVLPANLDDTATGFLKEVMFGKPVKEVLTPLRVVHPEEVKLFAEMKQLGGALKPYKSTLTKELEKFEAKHPQVRFSILKFMKNLR